MSRLITAADTTRKTAVNTITTRSGFLTGISPFWWGWSGYRNNALQAHESIYCRGRSQETHDSARVARTVSRP